MHPPGGIDWIGTRNFATYPLFSIQRAVARDTKYGTGSSPTRIAVMEGIKMFTIWSAEANFLEKSQGSIETGKLTHFVVLGADPLTTEVTKLFQIPVDITIPDGQVRHDRATATR